MPNKAKEEPVIKTISKNRKAHMRFSVLEAYEAGIELFGYEVKSLRGGKSSIEEGVIRVHNGQIYLMNTHIPPYAHLSHVDYNPTRTRRLLMHKSEIERLETQVQTKALALVPLEIYFKNGRVKVAVGLAKGKKTADRREEIKKREADREARRFRV